ncbi:MAG: dTMP kinase [Parachlamydiales bacterium]|nr:dTMP kinase [Parachlamydiales bacterium]
MSNNAHGIFITLEGGEGAGKSSLLESLFTYFKGLGFDVLKTREPGGGELADNIRKILLNPELKEKLCARSELFLFLAARAQHVNDVIIPALADGKVVICDRFHDSTLAYQGMARGLGFTQVDQLCKFSSQGLMPELTLFLDIDPMTGLQRASKTPKDGLKGLDRIELEETAFHECVRRGFLLLQERSPKRIITIDATMSQESVFEAAKLAIEKGLSHKLSLS